MKGNGLWLSWQSGRFQNQRSAVRIPSSEKLLSNIVFGQLYWKDEKKKKPEWPILKKNLIAYSRIELELPQSKSRKQRSHSSQVLHNEWDNIRQKKV